VAETPSLPVPLRLAVLLFFGSLFLGSVGALFGMSHGEPDSIEQLAWISSGAVLAQLPIVVVYALYAGTPNPKQTLRVIVVTFVLFTPLALATSGIAHAIFSYVGWEAPELLGHETLEQLKTSEFSTSMLIVILAATIGAGLIEEVVFRGLLQPSISHFLRGISVWGAIFSTSVIFSAMHIGAVPMSSLLGLFVLSIGLCLARVKTGGVFAPIIIHILFNAFNIAFVL
jgi:membrane protease YdiL (CAAX protease family)